MKDALSQMEDRSSSGRGTSLFGAAHMRNVSDDEKIRRLDAHLGGRSKETETIEVDDTDPGDEAPDEVENENEQGTDDGADDGDASEQQEQPTRERRGRESKASRDEGLADPSIDLENLERTLGANVGKKAAKDLIDGFARPLAARLNGVAAREAEARVERLVVKFGGVYPELKRKGAVNAVVSAALASAREGDNDETAFRRGLNEVYGDRKRDMREQTRNQMSAPGGRTTDRREKLSRDDINIAALAEHERTGDVNAALALKRKLSSR